MSDATPTPNEPAEAPGSPQEAPKASKPKNPRPKPEKVTEALQEAGAKAAKKKPEKAEAPEHGEPAAKPAIFTLPKPSFQDIKLAALETECGTQCRVGPHTDMVERYRSAMEDGDRFPRIKVFHDAALGQYYLVDGFRRVEAAKLLKYIQFPAEVYAGTLRDAILYSTSANIEHDKVGQPRTDRDKEQACLKILSDPVWSKFSNRAIGKHIKVAHITVAKYRHRLEELSAPKPPQAPSPQAPVTVGVAAAVSEGPHEADDPLAPLPGLGVSTGPRPAPPEPEVVTLTTPRESDEEFLADLPALKLLQGEPARRFRQAALDYREDRESPELAAYARSKASKLGRGKAGEMSAFLYKVACFLKIVHPREWKRCAECSGSGREHRDGRDTGRNCGKCHGDGFHVGIGS